MTPCPMQPLAAGQTLSCALAAGDELFCAEGSLRLQTSALAGIDALPGLSLQLHAGQGWRAPAALQLQVTAVGAPAGLRRTPAAARPLDAAPAVDWRARIGARFRRWQALQA